MFIFNPWIKRDGNWGSVIKFKFNIGRINIMCIDEGYDDV